eukprot:scpid75305/ scgid13240/ 
MSENEVEKRKQFEEEGDCGFRFTRKKSRRGVQQRRKSITRRRSTLTPVKAERSARKEPGTPAQAKEATQSPGGTVQPAAATSQPGAAQSVAGKWGHRTRPSEQDIEEDRAMLEAQRAEIAGWHSAIEQHEQIADDVHQYLERAHAECSAPLGYETLRSRVSEERLARLEALPDLSLATQDLEEKNQQLLVMADKLNHWRKVCNDLSKHTNTFARRRRKRIAEASHRNQASTTPIKIARLAASSATPAQRVSRRRVQMSKHSPAES